MMAARATKLKGAPAGKRVPGARKNKLANFISPQLATLVKEPPSGDEWLHELKFDGYRVNSGLLITACRRMPASVNTWKIL